MKGLEETDIPSQGSQFRGRIWNLIPLAAVQECQPDDHSVYSRSVLVRNHKKSGLSLGFRKFQWELNCT
jgi:hypothetical protein